MATKTNPQPHPTNDAGSSPRTPQAPHPAAGETQSPMREFFGEPIFQYTRAAAIADGVLVNLMQGDTEEVCRQHFKHPIACTAAVYAIFREAVENPYTCNDFPGLLHDALHMSKVYAGTTKQARRDRVEFRIAIQGLKGRRYVDLVLVVGPGDNLEPVMTLMLPNED